MTENHFIEIGDLQKKLLDIDLKKYYKSDKVRCMKCNTDIDELNPSVMNCPKCGYSTEESFAIWLIENAKFSLEGINLKKNKPDCTHKNSISVYDDSCHVILGEWYCTDCRKVWKPE